jgi:hypothetical protein
MGMRVKVDEDLPRAAVQMLRDRGYEAVSVMEQRMGGWKDSPLWQEEWQFMYRIRETETPGDTL